MAYTEEQVKSINANREALVNAGENPYTKGGATANSIATGQSPAGTQVINSTLLANPQSLVNVPKPKQDNTNYTGIVNSSSALIGEKSDMPDYLKAYLDTSEKPVNPAETLQGLETQYGVDEKAKEVNDLTGQINSIMAETQATSLGLKKTGASMGEISGRNIALEREQAIRVLPLQARLSAAQGNLELAQNKVNTYFQVYSAYQDRIYTYNKELRDKVYSYADKDEQRQFDQLQKEDDRKYNEQQQVLSDAKSLAMTALQNGQSDLFRQLMQPDLTAEQVASIGSQIQVRTTSNIPTIKSGALVVPESDIAEGQSGLEQARGNDSYVYTPLYLQMLQKWIDAGGLSQDFFSQYPPKNYLNPNDDSIPTYIKDKLKSTSSSSGDTFDNL